MSNSIPGLAIYRGSRRYQEVGYFSRIAIVCNAGILISEVSVPDVASYSRRNSTPKKCSHSTPTFKFEYSKFNEALYKNISQNYV